MIIALAKEIGFPEESLETLARAYSKLEGRMEEGHNALLNSGSFMDFMNPLAEETGVHPYTAHMVCLLYTALTLREKYREKGISDAIFLDTVTDLRYKLLECWKVYGVWGTFVGGWYTGFYRFDRFALGRLQYEKVALKCDYKHLKEGDTVLNCHIPSSGPVTRESVLDSLKKAYEFYGYSGLMPLVCSSWMLYQPHYEVYPENGNLRDFFDLFEILSSKEDPNNNNLWRVTNRMDGVVPEDTTLQRRLKAYLDAGNCMGGGYGILLFDGEKIIK